MTQTVFSCILGHAALVARLQSALHHGSPGHARLFHGPEGVGKQTVALAWIQSLFCLQPVTNDQGLAGCGTCSSCIKCTTGNHPDLQRLELLEKKSRISVDQVRELTRAMSFTPLESDRKVALIDDAALMNESAANALLKTLEEPPAHSVLILITSRPGALLPTIRSRCQQERFHPLAPAEMAALLQRLAPGLSPAEQSETIRLAGGSIGAALRLADPGVLEQRHRFFRTLESLSVGSLNDLIAAAQEWSESERFAQVPEYLETWFAERIRASVQQGASLDIGPEQWLEGANQLVRLAREARIFNLNARLTLEAIFIRLARMRGVAF
ncbi:MAG: DNA polymerase III subunit delta' [Magnetococcales bacterium]|nr:DNA polymerase III subunit delta' [Magnetococcales bacterium]NGZ06744.1 DNA polymerase III subunit delta' [Magnetococcales bacterium]